ncbi:hypothetical protein N0V90_011639 [Kalmusia sp. IMI 367209]|nr:hypothetical protein N0V90_011639 [Kalmusia sp. IMI 367209]
MDTPSGPKLLQQAEKILLRPIYPHLMSYCPTMDLIALVTDEENLDVYRANGQKAFGLKRKNEDVRILALNWQWNGAGIAVSWSDGCVDVVGVETGKVVHRDVKLAGAGKHEATPGKVGCIGWGLNFIDAQRVKRRTGDSNKGSDAERKEFFDFSMPTTEEWDSFKDDTALEDFLQRQPDFASLDITPDLPDQLAMMDTESLLPRLPVIPLPPANPMMRFQRQAVDAGAFSSQAQVDDLLHSQHLRDHNSVDMFIRCTEDGSVHPSIYDSMETVDVRLPKAWSLQSKVVMHWSHPYACTHSLLTEITSPTEAGHTRKKIAWVPLTLGFIPSAGIYLHLIAAKTAQLQNLMSYLTHTLSRIHSYFTHAQDLPAKFMRNIGETLEEHEQGDLAQNLYHLACTGHCPQLIHDWLVDELTEQGHKRWDNAVTSGFTTIIQLLHENFLPALDRCSVIITRLRGLAEFHDRDWIFSGPISDFTGILDVLKTLRLLASTTLLYATDEKQNFASFSKWLRYSIDFEATEPDSQSRAEMESQPPNVDIAMVLEYIQYGMARSDINPYLKSAKEIPGAASTYDEALKAIELLREGAKYKEESLCVEKVLIQFGEGVGGLLKQVSQWQENNIRMNCGIILEEGEVGEPLDMHMASTDIISTYIALPARTSPSSMLTIYRLSHEPRISGLSHSVKSFAVTSLTTQAHTILDVKFADDATLLLLLQSTSGEAPCSLASIPYIPSTNSIISYTALPTSTFQTTLLPTGHCIPPSSRCTIFLTPEVLEKHTKHVFEGRFTPLKLIVNGRKGRRVVVVLGSDRKHYRVLDLDFRESKERDGEGGEGDSEEESSGIGESDVEMSGA